MHCKSTADLLVSSFFFDNKETTSESDTPLTPGSGAGMSTLCNSILFPTTDTLLPKLPEPPLSEFES